MQRIEFEDTTVTRQPYVTIDGTDYEVQEGTYNGGTDLDAYTFNTLQDNIEDALANVGGNEIAIQDTEPTTETTKLWIDTGEIASPASEITNSYSESTGIGYACDYSNKHFSGVELYYNANGTNGTVTLNDSVENYNYIEIYYSNAGKTKSSSTKLMKGFYSTTLKIINISKTTTEQNTQEFYKDIAVSGTSITTTLNRSVYITSNVADYSTATITQGSDNLVYIYKVVGYK